LRFGPWYPLASAGDLAPAGESVLQLRLAHGLLDYPRGKSAMVHYEHTRDARATGRALAVRLQGDLLCRHLEVDGDAADLGALCARLVDDFERRFGARPGESLR
jgi:hypothetical protein